ncbi:MAG: hypothetical protein GC138_04600, partial [Gammaproteobacteria bacterium]|nr:hypothetical protein [Gammaproteobacteria bacterium]
AISAPDGHKHAQWQAENQSLEPLVKSVDVVFPSAYTFYRDQAGWKRMAVAQIMAARSYEKPVYVFLWPHYHDSNKFLSGYYIGDEYWRMELETVRQYADGVVIWGGWGNGKPQIWDDHAAWWEVTKKFLRDLGH